MRGSVREPHCTPHVIAITRGSRGREYHRCNTVAQALAHRPYLIEHVNGFGQVTHRERIAGSGQ